MIKNRLTDIQINGLYEVSAGKASEHYDSHKLQSIAISNIIIIELLMRLNEKMDKDVLKKDLILNK
jgi:hypothetical protein